MLIKVKVFPASKKQEVTKKGNSLEIKVKEKPIKGLANKAVIKALSEYLRVPERKIKLTAGFRQRNKTFEIAD